MFFLITCVFGALGVGLRVVMLNTWSDTSFPWVTLLVNAGGSLLVGLVYAEIVHRGATSVLASPWSAVLALGLLGGLTTYASFSLDVVKLMEAGQFGVAGLYILVQNLSCVFLCWLGYRGGLLFLELLPGLNSSH